MLSVLPPYIAWFEAIEGPVLKGPPLECYVLVPKPPPKRELFPPPRDIPVNPEVSPPTAPPPAMTLAGYPKADRLPPLLLGKPFDEDMPKYCSRTFLN